MAFADVVTLCRSWMTRLSPALLLIVCTGGFFLDAGFGVGLGCGFGWGFGCGFEWGFGWGCGCCFGTAGLGVGFGLAACMVLLLLLDTGLNVGLPGAGCVAVFGMILPSAVLLVTGAGAGAGVDASPGDVAVAVAVAGPEAGAGAPVKNVGVPAGGTADGALRGNGTGQRWHLWLSLAGSMLVQKGCPHERSVRSMGVMRTAAFNTNPEAHMYLRLGSHLYRDQMSSMRCTWPELKPLRHTSSV